MSMDNAKTGAPDATDTAIAQKIENALIVKGVNVRQLSEETGISYYALRRSLKGGRSFTFGEFGRIAYALDIEPGKLLPAHLTGKAAA